MANQGIDKEAKEDLVSQFTEGRTTSTREMKTTEAIALIRALNGQVDSFRPNDKADRMRKKILALCHEMKWELPDGKVNMDRVNGFCLSRGYLKKPLDEYSAKELPSLVTQFENLHKNYLKNA